ncbi:MAG: hypothetical protein MR959_03185 [Selenomonas bovis]|nr:hypothetical protein [Selenomonas bovis]
MSWARKRKRSENIDWLMRQTPAQSARYLRREDVYYEAQQAAKVNVAAHNTYEKLRKEIEKPADAYIRGVGDTVCAFIGFLRDGKIGAPFGRKRLEKFIHEFNAYMDGLQEGKVSGDNIAVALKDEIGLDVYAEFAKADKETQEAKKCRNTAS